MVYCFNCAKLKPEDEFIENRRHYQIKSRKGRGHRCNDCSLAWVTKNLKAVRYDFENSSWVVHNFDTKEQALKFLENERSTDIHK